MAGKKVKTAICTIVCRNYLPYARCLFESLRERAPGCGLFLLVIDGSPVSDQPERGVETLFPDQLGIGNLRELLFVYDVMEICTNVKPTLLKHLMNRRGYDRVIYFDPDIYLYRPPDLVLGLLGGCEIVITPHITRPVWDGKNQNELHYLGFGIFNLGFLALRQGPESSFLLDWWERRCLDSGFNCVRNGLFVDQKWMNFVPALCSRYAVLRDPGHNMAYWNLHYRTLTRRGDGWLVNGEHPLVFFHFSGFQHADIGVISKYQNRYDLDARRDLEPLYVEYRARLSANGFEQFHQVPYKYGYYSNGVAISNLARKLYWGNRDAFAKGDPFDSNGPFYRWTARLNANGRAGSCDKVNSGNVDRRDPKLVIFNAMLRAVLKVFGADRYLVLCKYLAFIGVVQNQREVFRKQGGRGRAGGDQPGGIDGENGI